MKGMTKNIEQESREDEKIDYGLVVSFILVYLFYKDVTHNNEQ